MPAERPVVSIERLRRGSGIAATLVVAVAALGAFSAAPSLADGPSPCGFALSAEAVLQRLNAIRTAGRVCRAAAAPVSPNDRPLQWSSSLAAAALTQAHEMALQNRMSHRDRADRALGDRLKAAGYRFTAAYENVAVGYGSVDDVVEAWLESEHHCENLMNAAVVELGLACMDGSAMEPRSERRYWTMLLATPPQR